MLGRTQFVGSEFGIFGGFEWVRSSGFLQGSDGFVVRYWLANLGLEGFEVRPLGFKAVRSSLILGSTQH